MEGPDQRGRRGLVAGHEHGDDLVAQLAVGHALAGLLVLGQHEHAQQVAAVARVGAAFGDEPVHGAVDDAHRRAHPQVRQARQPFGDADEVAEPQPVAVERADGVADAARLLLVEAVGEHRPGDDLHGHARHFGLHVERRAGGGGGRPAALHVLRQLRHRAGEAGDPLAVERRRGDAPLAAPERPLAGQQAAAEERLEQRAGDGGLAVPAGAGDEDVADDMRLDRGGDAREQPPADAEPAASDVAIDRDRVLDQRLVDLARARGPPDRRRLHRRRGHPAPAPSIRRNPPPLSTLRT